MIFFNLRFLMTLMLPILIGVNIKENNEQKLTTECQNNAKTENKKYIIRG